MPSAGAVHAAAEDAVTAKIADFPTDAWMSIEKSVMLQSLDHHWKEHLAMLDALRQVIHLRAHAQKKPIDEYKHEAFQLFERMLSSIREDVTKRLGIGIFHMPNEMQPDFAPMGGLPPLPEFRGLPDFITSHIDPFSGDDDSADIDAGTGNIISRLPPLESIQPAMPADINVAELPKVSRNAPCPCGSGQKYKHCHGMLA